MESKEHIPEATAEAPPAEEGSPSEENPSRICVIDLGTNSFHALIVDAFPNGTFQVVDKVKEVVEEEFAVIVIDGAFAVVLATGTTVPQEMLDVVIEETKLRVDLRAFCAAFYGLGQRRRVTVTTWATDKDK